MYGHDALRSCLVPADLRAALYRALQRHPDIRTLHGLTDLDGGPRIALVHEAAGQPSWRP